MANKNIVVGLALGSGAARGWAHLGVIMALREMGVQPQVIGGCSIGSLVGAAYACQRVDELTEWALSLSSWQVFNLLDISLNRGGLLTGEKVFNAAEKYIGASNIEQLKIPFGCVATGLESGKEIWLQSGKVRDAVRASCAMPGLMAPYQLNGQWLVDGAVVNPVPVSLVRAMGADVVIAVNLNSDKSRLNLLDGDIDDSKHNDGNNQAFWRLLGGGKDFLNSMLANLKQQSHRSPGMIGVMSTSINIMQERLTRTRMAGDPPDILLSPKLGNISTMDFHRAEEAIAEGKRVTELMRPQIEEELFLSKTAQKRQ
ncbi:patatin-like phospholipase RssA [Agarivorans sp. MS3-6]|uniref:patatin-like phospholipase RssA n=1 Tax=Agarivorans sp. TSD2052 TaxID=2937286 RepID=UPI00200C5C21|nr:patatin-like phospholipase RssA [Agarivorans sp. TSD2052]UPW20620.1 patatin-like phospholipase RssA [Agarivorans sp. TSD2052]